MGFEQGAPHCQVLHPTDLDLQAGVHAEVHESVQEELKKKHGRDDPKKKNKKKKDAPAKKEGRDGHREEKGLHSKDHLDHSNRLDGAMLESIDEECEVGELDHCGQPAPVQPSNCQVQEPTDLGLQGAVEADCHDSVQDTADKNKIDAPKEKNRKKKAAPAKKMGRGGHGEGKESPSK